MPLGKGVRYRWKGKGAKAVRLAFKRNKVIAVKKKGGKEQRVS